MRDLGAEGSKGLPMLHTSTCYVAGDRTGQVDEVNPLHHPFPKVDDLAAEHWSPSARSKMNLVDNVRHRANDAFRQSHFLDQAMKNARPQRATAWYRARNELKGKAGLHRQAACGVGHRAGPAGWHNIHYPSIVGRFSPTLGCPTPSVARRYWSSLTPPSGQEGINTGPLVFIGVEGKLDLPYKPGAVLDVIPVTRWPGMMATGRAAGGYQKAVYQYSSSMPTRAHRAAGRVCGPLQAASPQARQGNHC